MYVFYGISDTGEMSSGRFGLTDELSEATGDPIPEVFDEVWCVDLSSLLRWGTALPRYADELRFLGVPCCRECGDPGAVYYDYGACGPVVWCEACAVDLLPLLEVE